MGQDWKEVKGNEVDPRGQFPGDVVFIILVTGSPTPFLLLLSLLSFPLFLPHPCLFVAQAGLELMDAYLDLQCRDCGFVPPHVTY